jgi:hypothetical protein
MSKHPTHNELSRLFKATLVYFAAVFGAGSLLGPIRVLVVAPSVGDRAAELIELPIMIAVIILVAHWIVVRFKLSRQVTQRLIVGVLATGLGLVFEFGLVLNLRGMTLTQYFESRDPISTTAYYLTLVMMAIMPLLVKHDKNARASEVAAGSLHRSG